MYEQQLHKALTWCLLLQVKQLAAYLVQREAEGAPTYCYDTAKVTRWVLHGAVHVVANAPNAHSVATCTWA